MLAMARECSSYLAFCLPELDLSVVTRYQSVDCDWKAMLATCGFWWLCESAACNSNSHKLILQPSSWLIEPICSNGLSLNSPALMVKEVLVAGSCAAASLLDANFVALFSVEQAF